MHTILPVTPRREGLLNDAVVTTHLERVPLERITAPTLVITARDDGYKTWEGASYTAQHIRGARFVGYPAGGHLLVGHDREQVRALAAFLEP